MGAAIVATILVAIGMSSYALVPVQERAALISLYHNTHGNEWAKNSNWLGTPGSECTWFGISCENNHVVGITLPGNHLNGNLPGDLAILKNLKVLSFSNNQLNGVIPSELGQLIQLTNLHLYNNHLTGSIPVELTDLANLESLTVSENHLTGSIPREIVRLAKLRVLGLSYNQFTGELPADLWQLGALVRFDLSSNSFSGNIPKELGRIPNLKYLALDHNQFSGTIPADLGQLTNLEYLELNNNSLDGEIPFELSRLKNLIHLSLNNNSFSGNIPTEFIRLSKLDYLGLSNNCLAQANQSLVAFIDTINTKYFYSDRDWQNQQKTNCATALGQNADYDEITQVIEIRDLIIGSEHYNVKLQLKNNLFHLIYEKLIVSSQNEVGTNFDPVKQRLSISRLYAFGKYYQVTFLHLNNYVFKIDSYKLAP